MDLIKHPCTMDTVARYSAIERRLPGDKADLEPGDKPGDQPRTRQLIPDVETVEKASGQAIREDSEKSALLAGSTIGDLLVPRGEATP